MLSFIHRGKFAYWFRRRIKSLDEFVALAKQERVTTVAVGAKLDSPGIAFALRGMLLFSAQMSDDRYFTFEQKLFEEPGIGDERLPAKLYLLADQRVRDLKARLPNAAVNFEVMYLPMGIPVYLTDATRGRLTQLAIEGGVV